MKAAHKSALAGIMAGLAAAGLLFAFRNTAPVTQTIESISKPIAMAREREQNSDLIKLLQSESYDCAAAASQKPGKNPFEDWKAAQNAFDQIPDEGPELKKAEANMRQAAWLAFCSNPAGSFSSQELALIGAATEHADRKCSRRSPGACFVSARIRADIRNPQANYALARKIVQTKAKGRAAGYEPMENAWKAVFGQKSPAKTQKAKPEASPKERAPQAHAPQEPAAAPADAPPPAASALPSNN